MPNYRAFHIYSDNGELVLYSEQKRFKIKEDIRLYSVEHFVSGLETSLDTVLTVVEPSRESVMLAKKIKELCEQSGINFYFALINKSPSEDISEQIKKELENHGIKVLGSIAQDQDIFRKSLMGVLASSNASSALDSRKIPQGYSITIFFPGSVDSQSQQQFGYLKRIPELASFLHVQELLPKWSQPLFVQ